MRANFKIPAWFSSIFLYLHRRRRGERLFTVISPQGEKVCRRSIEKGTKRPNSARRHRNKTWMPLVAIIVVLADFPAGITPPDRHRPVNQYSKYKKVGFGIAFTDGRCSIRRGKCKRNLMDDKTPAVVCVENFLPHTSYCQAEPVLPRRALPRRVIRSNAEILHSTRWLEGAWE